MPDKMSPLETKRYRPDEQHKRILEANRYLLTKNIIHTPDLHSRLLSNKIVTETMVRDIQEGKTQQEMNERLINVLKLRNKNAYRKFTYVLLLTGHSLLADFLQDEDQSAAQYVTAADVQRRVPSVAASIGLDDMKKLCHYIDSKIKAGISKKMWDGSARERDRIEEIRREFFQIEGEKQRSLDRSQQKIGELKELLAQSNKQHEETEIRIKELKQEMCDIEAGHKEVLSKQMRFNIANNSTILKLSDRLVQYTGHITELTNKLQRSVKDIVQEQEADLTYGYGTRVLADQTKGKSEDRKKLAELDTVVSRLLRAAQNFNQDLKSMDDNTSKERETVLALLGSKPKDKNISTSEALKLFIDRENKDKSSFLKDIQSISSALKETKSSESNKEKMTESQSSQSGGQIADVRVLRSSLGMLREDILHISKRLQWKEAQIRALEEENAELKSGSLFRGRRLNPDAQPDVSVKQYSNSGASPIKHKAPVSRNRYMVPRKPAEALSERRKQRVLSPIEESSSAKTANSITFPTIDKSSSEKSKPVTNRA